MADLERFVNAQAYNYAEALEEIKNGKKCSCWMWYVFPQLQGLGGSNMAVFFAIENLQEARDYLKHEVLGKRLVEITEELLKLETNDAFGVFGSPDNMKLKSSMTLFAHAAPEQKIFRAVLDKYFDGEECAYTVNKIREAK